MKLTSILISLLLTREYDSILFTEIWLNNNINNALLLPNNNYTSYRLDKVGMKSDPGHCSTGKGLVNSRHSVLTCVAHHCWLAASLYSILDQE